jgi:hypothetical protein
MLFVPHLNFLQRFEKLERTLCHRDVTATLESNLPPEKWTRLSCF